ncbi:HET-domain-containing protein [Hypoxylon fuscum]|nr:HET-domain-containing protein [Hypoxylon fuscum]
MSETFQPWKDMPQDTGCISNLAQMSVWLRECQDNHKRCESRATDYMPTRVLDISRQEGLAFLARGDECQKGRYAALSHCWGGHIPVRTTTLTLPTFQIEGIPLTSLPKTFREAIMVARQLGCSYLWIDSLCIIQGDGGDWETEAPLMADVYSNSFVTLSASASADSTGGLFFYNEGLLTKHTIERQREGSGLITVYARPALDHPSYFLGEPSVETSGMTQRVDPTPLMFRSWCFQEWLFSPRVLFFTRREIIWQCREGRKCICGVYFNKSERDSFKNRFTEQVLSTDAKVLWKLWRDAVKHYTYRLLTYDSDKLAAIAAIAKHFSNGPLGRYVSGMWESTLLHDLQWKAHDDMLEYRRRNSDLTMPSWSWASVIGPVDMTFRDFDYMVKLVHILYEPDNANSLVRPSARAIILRGMIAKGRVSDHGVLEINGRKKKYIPDIYHDTAEGIEVYILQLTILEGLVICKLDSEEDTYRRLGYAEYNGDLEISFSEMGLTSTLLKLV